MAYLGHIDDPSILCDSTVFSDLASQSTSPLQNSMELQNARPKVIAGGRKPSASTLNSLFPVLPPAHNFSVLGDPGRFIKYITAELPAAIAFTGSTPDAPLSKGPPSPVATLRTNVNSAVVNSLLQTNRTEIVYPASDWVRLTIFPDDVLPCNFLGMDLLNNANYKLWDPNTQTMANFPTSMSEASIAWWLNNISDNLSSAHKLKTPPSDRSFDCRSSTKANIGSFMPRKPDICVLSREQLLTLGENERLHWKDVYAIVEVTGKSSLSSALSDLLTQFMQKASYLFDVQPQRRFICSLAILGDPDDLVCVFYIIDRAGINHSEVISLKTGFDFLVFLRIVFGLSFATDEALGLDPTMILDPVTKEVTKIAITMHETIGDGTGSSKNVTTHFDVIKLLHKTPVLFSRGTRVWIVRDQQGNYCILKDSWIQAKHMVSEIDFIKVIDATIKKNSENGLFFKHILPSFIIGEECVWSTARVRPNVLAPVTRHQRRIVTRAIGDPITSFRSKKEFVSVFLDLVNGLEFLNTKANINHGDLSINNIMINRVWQYEPGQSPSETRILYPVPDPVNSAGEDPANVPPPSLHTPSSTNSISPTVHDVTSPALSVDSGTSGMPPTVHDGAPSALSIDSSTSGIPPTVHDGAPSALSIDSSTSDIPPIVHDSASPALGVDLDGTTEDIEASGMLIDGDFMRFTDQDTHWTSGTPPFMAIEALKTNSDFKHSAGHDLESLLSTMLTICYYTIGPGGMLRVPVLGDEMMMFNTWFATSNREELARLKATTLDAFDYYIKPQLPDYWKDFAPYLQRLIQVTFEKLPYISAPNVATHQAYRTILKEALSYYTENEHLPPAPFAVVPNAKRPNSDDTQPEARKRARTGYNQIPRPDKPHMLISYPGLIVPTS